VKWWVQKTFQVLPTDERFKALTQEQLDILWEQYLLDHPDIEKKTEEVFHDPDYETAEADLKTDMRSLDAQKDIEPEHIDEH
jgi:hypothetical protein